MHLQVEDNWCIPSNATVTTSCQLNQSTEKTFLLNFPAEQINLTGDLPAHDLCNVTLSLQYSGEYISTPHEPFNISMLYAQFTTCFILYVIHAGFDTQSITVEFDRRSYTSLCVSCHFASWTGQTTCEADIPFLDSAYKDKRQTCFSSLPLDRQYIVNITVSDGRLALHFTILGRTPNNPTSGQ